MSLSEYIECEVLEMWVWGEYDVLGELEKIVGWLFDRFSEL